MRWGSMTDQAALIDAIITEVARGRGTALSRDDPVIDVVLGSERVLRATLEQALPPLVHGLRDATVQATDEIEEAGARQAHWLEQETLKRHAELLEAMKAAQASWLEEMQALIEQQETALRRVVVQTLEVVKTQKAARAADAGLRDGRNRPGRRTSRGLLALVLVLALGAGGGIGYALRSGWLAW